MGATLRRLAGCGVPPPLVQRFDLAMHLDTAELRATISEIAPYFSDVGARVTSKNGHVTISLFVLDPYGEETEMEDIPVPVSDADVDRASMDVKGNMILVRVPLRRGPCVKKEVLVSVI